MSGHRDSTPPHTIALDFDGVLCDVHGYACRVIQKEYDAEFTRDDIEWDRSIPNSNLTMGDLMWDIAHDTEILANTQPIPGAVDGVTWLADHPAFDPVLITHRPPSVHEQIETWLEGRGFPELEFPSTVPEDKTEIDYELDILIDDYHEHVRAAAADDTFGIHFTGAWEPSEEELVHDAIYQASTWDDVRALLTEHFLDEPTDETTADTG